MSAVERFRQAWEAKFPSEPPPDLPCLHVDQDQVRAERDAYGSVYGTVYSYLDPAAVEHTLQTCNANIAQLHLQLERQEFVAEYLWEVLHGINSTSPAEPQPAPSAPKINKKLPSHASVRVAAEPLKTDFGTAGLANTGLDNIVPIQESPSSGSFSPLSLETADGKVFSEDKAARLTTAGSTSDPVFVRNSKGLDKHKSVTRQHSLPLDQEQNNQELESESERMFSLDSKPQSLASVADSENGVVTPVNSLRKKHVESSSSLPYRQKPVPTPRITVNKQAASSVVHVHIEDGAVGESSTDDIASSSGNDSLQFTGISSSFNKLSLQQPAQSSAETVSSDDDDHKIRSVKERALAFTSPSASNTASSLVSGGIPKSADSDNLPSKSSASPRQSGRRAQRVHVYEEVVPAEQGVVDVDEAGAVSSDDEEPLYFNLKMLQQSMLNRAKTFYSKGSQRPVAEAERSKVTDAGITRQSRLNRPDEDDARQLSGDSSKYRTTFGFMLYVYL